MVLLPERLSPKQNTIKVTASQYGLTRNGSYLAEAQRGRDLGSVFVSPKGGNMDMGQQLLELVGFSIHFSLVDEGLLPYDSSGFIVSSEEWKQIVSSVDSFYQQHGDAKLAEYNQWKAQRTLSSPQQIQPDRHGYIYLLKGAGYYKIGRTNDVSRRIAEIEVSLPFKLELICTIKTDDMMSLEATIHNSLSEKRVGGEWFQLDQDDVEMIREFASLLSLKE